MTATSRYCLAALLLCGTAACTAKDISGNGTRNISVNSVSTSPSSTTLSLLGRVTDAATTAGVAGATLSIADGPNDGKSTTSDFGGNYAFLGLDASDFRVTITADRYGTQTKHVTLTANETLEFQLVKCTFAVSVGSRIDVPSAGSATPVTVTTESGCGWTATSGASWLHVDSPESRHGTDTVTVTADANAGAARTSAVTIAAHTITVAQAGR